MSFSEFVPFPFLRGAHRQTLAGLISRPHRPLDGTTIEKVALDPGDYTTIHYHVPARAEKDSPTLVLVHGLEGNASRPYLIRIAKKAAGMGVRTARMNMRWCGDAEGLSSKFYNSTHSGDVRKVCAWLRSRNPESPIWVAGFSLGGNLALKMAGEGGCEGLAKLVAVSPPVDLHLSSQAIADPGNRRYHRHFVKCLVQRARKFLSKFQCRVPVELDERMSLSDFDTVFTVPLGGFSSLKDYYDQGSPKRLLCKIGCRTLIITAQDDPLVPFESFKKVESHVGLMAPNHGGHLGFVGYPKGGDPDYRWAENRLLDFFTQDQPAPA